jgi:Zn-dependent metalloprotease
MAVLCTLMGVFAQAAAAAAQGGTSVLRGYTADGRLSFIGSAESPLPAPTTGSGALVAGGGPAAFVALYGPAFGLADPAREVALARQEVSATGRTTTRYRQVHQGVPVFGGDLVVNTDAGGRLLALSGKVSPRLAVGTAPGIAAEEAVAAATAALRKEHGDGFSAAVTAPAALWIYDEALFTESTEPPRLVWKMEISGLPAHAVRQVVLVDAQTGEVALSYNQIDTQWRSPRGEVQARSFGPVSLPAMPGPGNNIVRDALYNYTPVPDKRVFVFNDSWDYFSPDLCNALSDITACNDPATDDVDAVYAYLFAGTTWNFYFSQYGYDLDAGISGGTGLKSLINLGHAYVPATHPERRYWFDNAYWDGDKMNYGDLFATAEDVVAHEMTHGFTEHTSGLLYLYQSGAINESLSDVWGELVDQSYTDASEHDGPLYDWKMGEDLPIGAVRNMKAPTLYRNPDRMLSAYYYVGPDDQGGVHTNSGVNNKAAYLMTAGGTFNYRVVSPLGRAKVAQLYYTAQTSYLFPGADYYDLFMALQGSCNDLVLAGTADFTPADCVEVLDALKAVQMDQRPARIVTGPVAYCPAGYAYGTQLFFDDFEGGTGKWAFAAEDEFGAPITPSWAPAQGLFTSAADTVLYADGPATIANGSSYGGQETAAIAADVPLPPASLVFGVFEHLYKFETWISEFTGALEFPDGAVVEYSLDGGLTWLDASPRYSAGQAYNGVITDYNIYYNPLEGKRAFIANSRGGKVYTRYNFSPLAGQNLRLRFRIGYDFSVDWGWFIDNVDLYTCVPAPGATVLLTPALGALLYDYKPTLDWKDAARASAYQLQVFTDTAMKNVALSEPRIVGSTYTFATPLDPNRRYYWRVRSIADAPGVNDRASYGPWTALRLFRTALTVPIPQPPDPLDPPTDRPTLRWTASTGAVNYWWQACRNATCTLIVTQGYAKATQVQPPVDLPVDTTVWWRVKANGANPSAWSTIESFLTANPPTIPVPLLPLANALSASDTPTFTWRAAVPAVGDTVQEYEIQIGADLLFATVLDAAVVPVAQPRTYTSIALPRGRTCYWRVRSYDQAGEASGWSTPRALRIAYAGPALVTPGNTTTPATKTVLFDWDPVTGQTNAVSYTIQVSASGNFATLLVNAILAPTTLTRTFTQGAGTTLYWRVRANGGYGPGAWSTVYSLTLP